MAIGIRRSTCDKSKKVFLLFLGLMYFSSNRLLAIQNIDYYQEGHYAGYQKVFSQHQRLTWKLPFDINPVPYLRVGSEYLTANSELNSEHPESHAFGSLGLEYTYKIFLLSQEFRAKEYLYDAKTQSPSFDARSLFVINHFVDASAFSRKYLRLFSELYSETVYSTALSKNVIHTSFDRVGLRYAFLPRLTGDIFTEPKIVRDSLKHSYNNTLSVKGALRLNGSWERVTASLHLSRVHTYYMDIKANDTAYKKESYWGNQVLFTLGGMI